MTNWADGRCHLLTDNRRWYRLRGETPSGRCVFDTAVFATSKDEAKLVFWTDHPMWVVDSVEECKW